MSVYNIEKRGTKYFSAERPVLPEWTRFAWASVHERGWWRSLLTGISRAWIDIERYTVVHGVRNAAWTYCSPEELISYTTWATDRGLVVLPRERSVISGSYQSSSNSSRSGPWHYRTLLTRPELAATIKPNTPNNVLGELLGFPACCRDMFDRTWAVGQVDSTWDQIAAHGPNGPIEANMFWRWLGVRWVSHLPCSCQCAPTVEIGKQYRETARKLGYVEEIAAIDAILRWPVQWSAINGIAEIVGPAVKISTRTDWTHERRNIMREGTYQKPESWLWTDNAFRDAEVMRVCHQPIVRTLVEHAPRNAKIVDLGCGNGVLLKRAKMQRPDIKIGGIDIKADAIAHAADDLSRSWIVGRMEELAWIKQHPTGVVVNPVRLIELAADDPASAARLREAIQTIPFVVVYGYADSITTYGSLTELCKTVGLGMPAITFAQSSSSVVQVGILTHRI